MPIAKYALLNLQSVSPTPPTPPPPTPKKKKKRAGGGGGVYIPYAKFVADIRAFEKKADTWGDEQRRERDIGERAGPSPRHGVSAWDDVAEVGAFEQSTAAWELGHDQFEKGKPIDFSQFTSRAFQGSYHKVDPMKVALAGIEQARLVIAREKAIRIAKYTAIVAGVSYVTFKVITKF